VQSLSTISDVILSGLLAELFRFPSVYLVLDLSAAGFLKRPSISLSVRSPSKPPRRSKGLKARVCSGSRCLRPLNLLRCQPSGHAAQPVCHPLEDGTPRRGEETCDLRTRAASRAGQRAGQQRTPWKSCYAHRSLAPPGLATTSGYCTFSSPSPPLRACIAMFSLYYFPTFPPPPPSLHPSWTRIHPARRRLPRTHPSNRFCRSPTTT